MLLALFAALAYGTGDFVGGLGGRWATPGAIAVTVQGVGVLTALLAVVVLPGGPPTAAALGWGAIGGIGSGIGNSMLFRGLSRGRMSVVAPLSAIITAAVPAATGVLLGDRLPATAVAGMILALPAIALIAGLRPSADVRAPDLGYGLAAGCGFGLLFVAMDQAGSDSGAWPLVPGQTVALLVALLVTGLSATGLRGPAASAWRSALGPGAASGILGASANLLFLTAAGAGALAVVAVLSSLYPAITVVLAAAVLGERPNRLQGGGLVCAAAAVVLIVLR